jgi:hypothetical protein
MVLKSVIKRICHTAFKDIVNDIDNEDNENYDLDLVDINETMQHEINDCKTIEDVKAFYYKYMGKVDDNNSLVSLCTKKKNEIKANQNVANN